MATKKGTTKKAVKPVKTVSKAPSKTVAPAKSKAAVSRNGKAVSKTVVKKAEPKKAAPAKKAAVAQKAAVKAQPAKSVTSKKPDVKKVALKTKVSEKLASKGTDKAEAVKKPTVSAKTHHEVKPAIKPLEKQQVKKETAKPTKFVIPKTSTDKAIPYEPDFTKSVLDAKKQQAAEGPTQRYSDPELAEFRDLINRKLESAKKELAYLQGLITRKDEGGDLDEGRYMTMEDGSMSMEREQLSQMASRQIQFIDHLEKAIMRIENKTYGICRVTGKLIDKARLRAVPHATLSIEAKQMLNK
jgi:RNA polymerase-binding transcription factor DksA